MYDSAQTITRVMQCLLILQIFFYFHGLARIINLIYILRRFFSFLSFHIMIRFRKFLNDPCPECSVKHALPRKTQISLRICAVWSVFVVLMKKLSSIGYPKCVQWISLSDCANARSTCPKVRFLKFGLICFYSREREQFF